MVNLNQAHSILLVEMGQDLWVCRPSYLYHNFQKKWSYYTYTSRGLEKIQYKQRTIGMCMQHVKGK